MKTIKEKIIIHAVSIHAGGGKVLLDKLLTEKTLGEVTALISDSRYTPPLGVNENMIIYRAQPTLKSRWKAEGLLKSYTDSHPGHVVLCFSNLPPALKLNAKVILYLQNALLLPNVPLYVDSLRSRLRTIYEKIWLQLFWKNIDEVWVQTNWMKEALAGKKTPVVINPIKPTLPSPEFHEEKKYDFITVTGSSPHKRLSQLLDAWELMPTPAPSLLIITDWVTRKNEAKLAKLKDKNITVKTVVTRDEIFKLYNQSRCLILTSKVESYCLPIYEALNYNLKIMAPDEKYVKEACTPDVIIDPDNIQEMHWKIENFYNHLTNKTKVLKILNVNMSIDPVAGGGTSERTVQMSKALKEIGHQCSILTLNLGVTESRMNELKGIQVTTLPCLIKRFYIPWPRLSEISNLVKKSDIIHLMGHWTLINVLVYFYIRKFNKKYVVCPAGALPVFGRSQISKKIFNYYIGKKIIQNADAHILVAQSETGHFADYGVTEEKMFWIPNGIDPKLYRSQNDSLFREKFTLGESPFILFIGRLNPIKGPDLFIEAFCSLAKQFPDYHVVLAGPDEGMLPQLKKTVSTHQLNNRVHFIGHISGETKSQALHAASLMVIPSRQEAMSIVVLEAGIVKLPVLLTDQCGLNYLDSINAGKVVPATVEGIRNGLSKILSHQDELKTMGENLYQHVIENYLWSSVVAKINSLYEKILKI